MALSTLGVIYGNRNFFPDPLITDARQDLAKVLDRLDIEQVALNENQSKLGGVETHEEARRCADLFKQQRDKIDGILVVLPNFGDEKGVADTIRLAGLDVPVLIQGYPDELGKMKVETRRDAFCGKISVCNNLMQYGIKYSLTRKHVVHPEDESFIADLKQFIGVWKVVNGLKNLRLGAVGARPGAFNTVRYSEKVLERNGISGVTADLSEMMGLARQLEDADDRVMERIEQIQGYAPGNIPDLRMNMMAKLGVALSGWMDENNLQATAIQCWTSVQENYGCSVCTLMSMMSEDFMPSACEVDVTGTLTMYAMQLASGSPSALVDWNNNYAEDENKCVMFHCGNWAKHFLPDIKSDTADILGSILGPEKTYGTLMGRTPEGPLTFGRLSTDDFNGTVRAYVGQGQLTNDELETFGTVAVADVADLQGLMQYVCRQGFEHHAVMNLSQTAGVLVDAFENYMGWTTHHHLPG